MHSLLQDYMPLPPEDCLLRSDSIVPPEFEFTKVECLLFAFHTVSKQVRYYNMKTKAHIYLIVHFFQSTAFLAENPERLKEFRVST